MNKTPNQRVIDLLNSAKAELLKSYNKYSEMYTNAKDEATQKKAIDEANIIVAEHKAVVAYIKRYYDLFTALNTPNYNGNPEIIKQIESLEVEVLKKYGKEQEQSSSTPALEKGKKYGVTETKKSEEGKDRFLGIVSTIGALILTYIAIDSLGNIDMSSAFDGVISGVLYGGIAAASGWGVVALGKYAAQKFKEANAESKSK